MLAVVKLAPSQAETSSVWLFRIKYQCISIRLHTIEIAGIASRVQKVVA